MPLSIIRNDITKMEVDAIVNAANTNLQAGGGVCGAIFTAAGADKLQKACNKLAPIKTGEAVITKSYALSAKYIIHTAGPVYHDGQDGEEILLSSCYINSLNLAKKHRCKSIAFPLISSCIYGYPKAEALAVATSAISEWLQNNEINVSLVVFDKTAFALSDGLLGEVKSFVDENYVDEREQQFRRKPLRTWDGSSSYDYEAAERTMAVFSIEEVKTDSGLFTDSDATAAPFDTAELPDIKAFPSAAAMPTASQQASVKAKKASKVSHKKGLDEYVGRLDEPFSATLMRLIDAKGKTDIEVYKRANLDRKLFSKIRAGKGYMPSKKTAVALAIALELSLKETRDLLERAGFALSHSVVFDVIIEYFIIKERYDIFEINNVLFEYDQPLLGG